MVIQRAYKTKLQTNNQERTWCRQCAGAARWCYNWGLDAMKTAYAEGRKTSVMAEKKRLNAIKDEVAPWLRDVPYTVLQAAFDNLDSAYKNFFRRVKQGEKPGFPKFKPRRNHVQSFNVRGNLRLTETHIKLPRIGWLRIKEHGYLPTANRVRVLSATLSSRDRGDTWYISLQVEEDIPDPELATAEPIGVDVGIHHLAALSDGTIYDNPRPLIAAEHKVKRLSRELARRKKGGANWRKTRAKLNRAHGKVRRIRQHTLHDVSHDVIARKPSTIVLEDLNVKGMVRNHRLAKAIADASFSELRRQLTYKAQWAGIEIKLASQWFPSSKTCSNCGCIWDDLALADREYHCPGCGFVIDRDVNAALNLVALA